MKILPEVKEKIFQVMDMTPQAFGAMRSWDGCLCFIGAICQAFHEDTGIGEWRKVGHDEKAPYEFVIDRRTYSIDLAYEIRLWMVGKSQHEIDNMLTDLRTDFVVDDRRVSILTLNDSRELTFEEFKKLVEEQWCSE